MFYTLSALLETCCRLVALNIEILEHPKHQRYPPISQRATTVGDVAMSSVLDTPTAVLHLHEAYRELHQLLYEGFNALKEIAEWQKRSHLGLLWQLCMGRCAHVSSHCSSLMTVGVSLIPIRLCSVVTGEARHSFCRSKAALLMSLHASLPKR